MVRRVLDETGHDVFARRRHGGIGKRGNNDIDVRTARIAAVLGIVVSALHVVNPRRNRNRTAQMWPYAWQRLEAGQRIEREIYLARRAAKLVTLDVFDKVLRQILLADHFQEGQARIYA